MSDFFADDRKESSEYLDKVFYVQALAKAERKAVKIEDLIIAEHVNNLIIKINGYVKNNDIKSIIKTEYAAIKSEAAKYHDTQKRSNLLIAIPESYKIIEEVSNLESAKSHLKLLNRGTLPDKIPRGEDTVRKTISDIKSYLTTLSTTTASSKLKDYYTARAKAMDFVREKYIEFLKRPLEVEKDKDKGKDKSKSKGKGKNDLER